MQLSRAVLFAILSLLFAGMNDVVFKRYSSRDRSRGMYVLGIGVVWTVLQTALFLFRGGSFSADPTTLSYGFGAGLVLTLSNILLIESMTHIDASLGSTIYRLNTIGVVLLAWLFLHESIAPLKAAGIAAGIVGVFLLARRPDRAPHAGTFRLFAVVAVAASLLRAVYGVVTRSAVVHGAAPEAMLVMIAACWIAGGAVYALAREKRFRITGKKAAYSAVSGVLVFLIVNCLMRAVELGEASTVIPIANMSFVVAFGLSASLGMEGVSRRKVYAVLCACLSVLLLSRS
jgi:drug/metabolite transporter (DMT)-like permease